MYPNLRAEMARKNVTMVELAEKTGIPYTTLTANISGKSDNLTIEKAIKIKNALNLNMSLEYLFAREEN